MGQHIEDLKDKRNKLAQKILYKIKKWDESADHAAEIIEENDLLIEQLRGIDSQIKAINPTNIYDEDYESYIQEILEGNIKLLDKVAKDKESILKSIKDTGKSQQVLKSYVTSFDESIFINKDI